MSSMLLGIQSREPSVGIVTGYGLDGPGIESLKCVNQVFWEQQFESSTHKQ
jgi:hypothetical protein